MFKMFQKMFVVMFSYQKEKAHSNSKLIVKKMLSLGTSVNHKS